ncbi:hypothetical protein YC2023_007733 [Brassica napus]
MPLGERGGWERSESIYCGVETDFSDDVPSLLSLHISTGGFDYVLAPLVRFLSLLTPFSDIYFLSLKEYRPSLVEGNGSETQVLPVSGSDLVLSPSQWRCFMTPYIEVGEEKYRLANACLLPTPKGTSCANYARCVKPDRLLCEHDNKLSVALDVM